MLGGSSNLYAELPYLAITENGPINLEASFFVDTPFIEMFFVLSNTLSPISKVAGLLC